MTQITTFAKGETVQLSRTAKDRSDAVLDLTGASVYFTIANTMEGETAPLLEFADTDSEVTITDAVNGLIEINLSPTALTTLIENQLYYHTLWVVTPSGVELLQDKGKFQLLPAVQRS